jgi:predicted RNA-binding protein with RPS1 domain
MGCVVTLLTRTKTFLMLSKITSFLQDYNDALTRANSIDSKVDEDASAISADYSGIVTLSIRQLLATVEITISKNSDGSFNTSDILIFMKG